MCLCSRLTLAHRRSFGGFPCTLNQAQHDFGGSLANALCATTRLSKKARNFET